MTDVPIVFVPALMGSELVRNNEEVYVTSSIGLGLSTPDVSLPLQWTHEYKNGGNLPTQKRDDIIPGEVLGLVKLRCCCSDKLSVTILDQYSTFTRHFEQYQNFYTFPYDWRRDLNETTDALLSTLAEIKQKHGRAAQVVSHSMGCLIALAAYHTKSDLFHSTLFCGGMFAGGFGFYPTNTDGMPVGLNKSYLGPKVVHTFPSMYASASPMNVGKDPILRTEDGRQLWQLVDSKSTDRTIDIDMWDINHWKKYKLGPWSLVDVDDDDMTFDKQVSVSNEMEKHVKTCLQVGFKFQLKMRNLDEHFNSLANDIDVDCRKVNLPPVATLVGNQFRNPSFFLWEEDTCRMIEWTPRLVEEYKPKHMGKTDGTVSYISASQPPGLPRGMEIFEYNARNNGPGNGHGNGNGTHRDLMDDVELIDRILKEMRGIVDDPNNNVTSSMIRHACF